MRWEKRRVGAHRVLESSRRHHERIVTTICTTHDSLSLFECCVKNYQDTADTSKINFSTSFLLKPFFYSSAPASLLLRAAATNVTILTTLLCDGAAFRTICYSTARQNQWFVFRANQCNSKARRPPLFSCVLEDFSFALRHNSEARKPQWFFSLPACLPRMFVPPLPSFLRFFPSFFRVLRDVQSFFFGVVSLLP